MSHSCAVLCNMTLMRFFRELASDAPTPQGEPSDTEALCQPPPPWGGPKGRGYPPPFPVVYSHSNTSLGPEGSIHLVGMQSLHWTPTSLHGPLSIQLPSCRRPPMHFVPSPDHSLLPHLPCSAVFSRGGGGGLFGGAFSNSPFHPEHFGYTQDGGYNPFTSLTAPRAFATTVQAVGCLVPVPPLAQLLLPIGVGSGVWIAGGGGGGSTCSPRAKPSHAPYALAYSARARSVAPGKRRQAAQRFLPSPGGPRSALRTGVRSSLGVWVGSGVGPYP